MKSIFRLIFCVGLMACSIHVFAGVKTLDENLYCKVYSKSTSPTSIRSLKEDFYNVGKVQVKEYSTCFCCFFKKIIKYKSLELRKELVNKCITQIGNLTEYQIMTLDFYVWNKSYINTPNHGYFKLEIDDDESKESIKEIVGFTYGVLSAQNMFNNENKIIQDENTKNNSCLDLSFSPTNDISEFGKDNINENRIIQDENTENDITISVFNTNDVSELDEAYANSGVLIQLGYAQYKGEVNGNIPHGKGTLFYTNGDKYEGDLKDGKRDGKGILYFVNNRKYEGDFKNDKYHGQGIMTYPCGSTHNGRFENGKKHGEAIANYIDGNKYEGMFKKGKKHGKATVTCKDGKKYECVFENGKRIYCL